MKQIYPRYANGLEYFELGQPVTIQRFVTQYDEDDFDRDLVWCNHAGYYEEVSESWPSSYDEEPRETMVYVCDKCGAHRHPGEIFWYDAPYEGITE